MVKPEPVARLLAAGLLAASLFAACSATDGDVLRSHGLDGAVTSGDAAPTPDGPDLCTQDGPCPTPSAGNFTLCGRVHDLETTEALSSDGGPGAELTVRIYDVTKLASDDDLPLVTATLDSCGWFVAPNIPGIASGLVALTTDDTQATGTVFGWAGSVVRVNPGQVGRVNAFALRSATESAWAANAGLSPGAISGGSLLAIYTDLNQPPVGPFQGTPVVGVELTRNGLPLGGDDYYFSDAAVLDRRTVAAGQSSTGANGSGFATGLSLSTEASGSKSGCSFVDVTAMTVVPILQVQEIRGTCN